MTRLLQLSCVSQHLLNGQNGQQRICRRTKPPAQRGSNSSTNASMDASQICTASCWLTGFPKWLSDRGADLLIWGLSQAWAQQSFSH